MPPFASRAPVQADQGISPKLMVTIAGLFAVFLIVIIGFCLVSSKKCCPPRTSATDRPQSVPQSCQHAITYRRPPTRPGLAMPVASIPRCPACKTAHRTAEKASRVSQESIRSPATLSPSYSRRDPTLGVLPTQTRSSSPSCSSPATPTMPPSPPLGYKARGPTATLRPAVW
ncbi:hypothetical protein V8D89_005438 [Ganoderma adspersum]